MIIDEQRKKPKNTGLKIFGILYFSFINIHFGGVGQKYPFCDTKVSLAAVLSAGYQGIINIL